MTKRSSQSTQHSPSQGTDKKGLVKSEGIMRSIEAVKNEIANLTHKDDPNQVLKAAEKKLMTLDYKSYEEKADDPILKAMTLREFDNGTLMSLALSDYYKTFGIDLMRKFQVEYGCLSPSEKSTAELAAVSFMRVLDIQRRMKNYLEIGTFTGIGVQYVATLSKELDRANRHYLTAIQTLRMLRQPVMQLNIKANTAVVGQNQIIQANTNNEPK